VLPDLDGDLELGTDAVGGRDEDGITEAGGLGIDQRAEPAQTGVGSGAAGGTRQRLDRLDERVAGVDIDSRRAVTAVAVAIVANGALVEDSLYKALTCRRKA
jgi:hypothetical protein